MRLLAPLTHHALGSVVLTALLAALLAAAAMTTGASAGTGGKAAAVRAPGSVESTIPLSTVGMTATSIRVPIVPGPASGVAGPHVPVPVAVPVPNPLPAGSGSTLGQRHFTWPLSPRPRIQRGFERPLGQWSRGHRGADLLSATGQPVLSAGDGVVAFSGVVAGRGVITVRHSGGLRTTYEPVDERATTGTPVHRGTPIGVIAAVPGHCLPLTCLHWGAISGQTYLDPLSLVNIGRPILLPLS